MVPRRPTKTTVRHRLPTPLRWRARYTGPDGKKHSAATTFLESDDAYAWLSNERKIIDRGDWIPTEATRTGQSGRCPHCRGLAYRMARTAHPRHQPTRPRHAPELAAVERDMIDANPVVLPSAAKAIRHDRKLLPENQVSIDIIKELDPKTSTSRNVRGDHKLIAILTLVHGVRLGEALGAQRKDFTKHGDTWTFHINGNAYRVTDGPKEQRGMAYKKQRQNRRRQPPRPNLPPLQRRPGTPPQTFHQPQPQRIPLHRPHRQNRHGHLIPLHHEPSQRTRRAQRLPHHTPLRPRLANHHTGGSRHANPRHRRNPRPTRPTHDHRDLHAHHRSQETPSPRQRQPCAQGTARRGCRPGRKACGTDTGKPKVYVVASASIRSH